MFEWNYDVAKKKAEKEIERRFDAKENENVIVNVWWGLREKKMKCAETEKSLENQLKTNWTEGNYADWNLMKIDLLYGFNCIMNIYIRYYIELESIYRLYVWE